MNNLKIGAMRMRKEILKEVDWWWKSNEQHIRTLIKKIKDIKIKDIENATK